MSARTSLILALGFALVHLVLALVYANITPYRQAGILLGQRDPATGQPAQAQDIGAPDERQHANYVQRLLDGKGFPVLGDPNEVPYENYQAHQPPLFYVLGAGWSRLTGAMPTDPDSGKRLRWLNSLVGAGTVIGTYFLALWGLRRADVGVIAAAFVALLPMNCALSGAISNDPLLFTLCTWTLALAALAIRDGWTWKYSVAVAVLTGAALLTKTTAVALLPALLVAALVPQAKKPSLAIAGAVALIAMAIASPWWIRNQKLYGDPLAMSAFQKAFTGSPTPEIFTSALEQAGESPTQAKWTYWSEGVGWWTARSFIGVFGYMDIWLSENGRADNFPAAFSTKPSQPNALYRISLAVLLILILGWLVATFKIESKDGRTVQIVNLVFFATVLILFIRFNMQYFQGQARYLFPALGPIGVGVGLGAVQLSRGKWILALTVITLLLGGINVYALSKLPAAFQERTIGT